MTRPPSDLGALYDAWHSQLTPDEGAGAPWHELIKPYLTDLTDCRVLEIGCGRGGLSAWLGANNPLNLVAADLSGEAVLQARRLEPRHTSFAVADIARLPLAAASFDVVVSCETVEHVEHPVAAIREMARVLRPGGKLYLTVPNYLNAMGLYRLYVRITGRQFSEGGQPLNHFTFIPRTSLWLRRGRLRTTQRYSLGHYLPWPARPPMRSYRLDGHWLPLRWLGLHSIFIAEKQGQSE